MYKIRILPAAQQDIRTAAQWYNKRQKGLGKRFTTEVRNKVYFIQQFPNASNIRYNRIRTAVLNVFPFMIHYVVNDADQAIIITAVLHTSRSPKVWMQR
ncbi:type II toxin-antitoxin system RelE/ParE family toxin [Puteibacter caeruleilacunae]|nr:type II toxin-antitoxin system RelE/ParE family toxin [Puteibacter caeruleilacunae]